MAIRLMKIQDYEKVYELWHDTKGMGMRSLDDSYDGIVKFLKRNPTTCFVSEIDNKINGTILCGHDGRRAYIYHTAVDINCRNKGIGNALVDAVIDALKKENINKVALVVYKDNNLGNNLWEKLGFILREDLNYRNYTINIHNE